MADVLRFIYRNLDQYRIPYVLFFILSMIDGVALFFIPVIISEFTRTPLTIERMHHVIISLVALYTAILAFQWVIRRYAEVIGIQFSNYLRCKLFKQGERLSVQRLQKNHSGYLLSLVNKVCDEMPGFMGIDLLWSFAHTLASFFIFFIFAARESRALAGFNLFLLLVFSVCAWLLAQKMVIYARELNTQRATMLQHFSDFMANIVTIKKLGVFSFAEGMIIARTDSANTAAVAMQIFHAKRWFILHTLYGFMIIGTLSLMLYFVTIGRTPLSILILFVGAFFMINRNVVVIGELMSSRSMR